MRVEREREEQARSAVVSERARSARELHHAVAHIVTVMVLQAGGVRRPLGDDPAREREALLGIEETGRQAVGEAHRVLGKSEPGLAPSPSPRRVGEQVRGAGARGAGRARRTGARRRPSSSPMARRSCAPG